MAALLQASAIWVSAPDVAEAPVVVLAPVEEQELAAAPVDAAEGAACLGADGRHTYCPARL